MTWTLRQEVDEMAVERVLMGSPVRLNIAERREAVRALRDRGLHDPEIAKRIGVATRTVVRIRQRLGLPSVCGGKCNCRRGGAA